MLDMDKAAGRLRLALERDERIAVYGDYDVDGITATCLLTDFLRSEGAAVISYIPDRMEEGYGLNRDAVNTLHRQGVSLIVTVDCGITAVDEAEYAQRLGVDVVVTDHHRVQGHAAPLHGGGGPPPSRLSLSLQVPGRRWGGAQAGAGPGRPSPGGRRCWRSMRIWPPSAPWPT